jgi:hypothetical protein
MKKNASRTKSVNINVEISQDALDLLSFRYYKSGIATDDKKLIQSAVNEVAYYQYQMEMAIEA